MSDSRRRTTKGGHPAHGTGGAPTTFTLREVKGVGRHATRDYCPRCGLKRAACRCPKTSTTP